MNKYRIIFSVIQKRVTEVEAKDEAEARSRVLASGDFEDTILDTDLSVDSVTKISKE